MVESLEKTRHWGGHVDDSDGEWQHKGATLSDKTAREELPAKNILPAKLHDAVIRVREQLSRRERKPDEE